MEREEIAKFTNAIVLLSKLLNKMEDKFLVQKLYEKISDLVGTYVAQKRFHNVNNVVKSGNIVQHNMSHNITSQNLLNSASNLLDYLEYLAHISKSDTTPLFLAQRNLLKFKLHILKRNKAKEAGGTSDVPRPTEIRLHTGPSPGPDVVNSAVLISSSPTKTKLARLTLKSNSNKERIFNFIKRTPDVRTKDVLSEFNALSGRTVKRSLKELTEEGLLKKRSDGVAVYYFQASE